jgi:hypothetical protein
MRLGNLAQVTKKDMAGCRMIRKITDENPLPPKPHRSRTQRSRIFYTQRDKQVMAIKI